MRQVTRDRAGLPAEQKTYGRDYYWMMTYPEYLARQAAGTLETNHEICVALPLPAVVVTTDQRELVNVT